MSRTIDYGNLMHCAMREMIRNVLRDVQRDGLPGNHHFFITFDTAHPHAKLADWLRERHPNEMTVALQHWFEGLDVSDAGITVTLKFSGKPEILFIPFDAVTTFADPSVEFGIRFESTGGADEEEAPMESAPEEAEHKDAEVISLDSFRGQRK